MPTPPHPDRIENGAADRWRWAAESAPARRDCRLAILLLPLVFSSCNSPRFRDEQAVRDNRMRRQVAHFQKREKESRENLDDLYVTHQRMVDRHAEHRGENRELIERQIQKRQVERRKEMREFIDVFRRENSDDFPDTWAKMFY